MTSRSKLITLSLFASVVLTLLLTICSIDFFVGIPWFLANWSSASPVFATAILFLYSLSYVILLVLVRGNKIFYVYQIMITVAYIILNKILATQTVSKIDFSFLYK